MKNLKLSIIAILFLTALLACKKEEDSNYIYTADNQINLKAFIDFAGSNYYFVKDRTINEKQVEVTNDKGEQLQLFLKDGHLASFEATHSIVRSVKLFSDDDNITSHNNRELYSRYYAYLNGVYGSPESGKAEKDPDIQSRNHRMEWEANANELDYSMPVETEPQYKPLTWITTNKTINISYDGRDLTLTILTRN